MILHVGNEACSTLTPEWFEYDQDNLNLSELKQLLVDHKPQAVGIKNIPNARLPAQVALVQELSDSDGLKTIHQLRQTLQQQKYVWVEPQQLWSWNQQLPYQVYITWSRSGEHGCYDAIFVRNESPFNSHRNFPVRTVPVEVKPWSAYANNPLEPELNRHLVSQLPSFLQQKLPEYMLPSAFVTLDKLPLTPNGKVDYQALPAPDGVSRSHEYVAPRTPTEEIIANIFANVLGVEHVGVYDNFFELGGHSLAAVQLVSKISTALNISLLVKTLFLHPTVAELANSITELRQNINISQEPSSRLITNEVQETLNEGLMTQTKSEYIQLETPSLLSLFSVGKIPPVDGVALGYLRDSDLEVFGWSRDYIINNLYENLPVLTTVQQTNWGRIGVIIWPRFSSDLYSNQDDAVMVIIEALEMAARIGAKFVSLTGLIPSATDYGSAITKAIANRQDLPKITTGHSTTSAAVVLTIKKICEQSQRNISGDKVGFIGLGSVGMNVLSLMLKCLPHPQ